MVQILYLSLSFIYIFFLPGYFLTFVSCKQLDTLTRLALGLGLSIIIIPITSFSIAIIMGTFVKESLVFSIATAINAVSLGVLYYRKRK